MNTELQPGETIVKKGRANLQRGAETVGGRLFLTDRRLIFEAHKMNVQRQQEEVARDQITSVTKAWMRFLGIVPLAPNTLAVATADKRELRLVLSGREEWRRLLEQVPLTSET